MLLEIEKMDLRTYLFFKRRSIKSLADAIDYTPSQLSAVVNGRRRPGRKLARLIEKATNGDIKAVDLLKMEIQPEGNDHV
jgi:hypothetical protein